MNATVIKLIILLVVALLATLTAIIVEVRTHNASRLNTGIKSVLAVVLTGLLISVI